MAEIQNKVLFVSGTSTAYAAITTKNPNTIYFLTDTKQIYKGDILFSENQLVFTETVPSVADMIENCLYIVDGVIYIKDGESAQAIGGNVQTGGIQDIDAFAESLIIKSTDELSGDDKIPTAEAVKNAISTAVSDYDGAIVDVSAARSEDNSGTVITFTKKDSTTKSVTIADLFLSAASYDADTHKLSLTVKNQTDPVEVDLTDLVPEAVNTSQVALAKEIKVTTDVGNFKKGDVITVTDNADLQTLLTNMLSQDSNPVATAPTLSVTLTDAGAKEVGTLFTPSYTTSFNAGKYTANGVTQPSGVNATSYNITDTNNKTSTTANGSLEAFTVEASTNYKITATVNYSEGNIPKTYLGKDYPEAKISAGSKTANSSVVTGYRSLFWGFKGASDLIADPTAITSADLRATSMTKGQTFPTTLTTNKMQQIFFAAPKGVYKNVSVANSTNGAPQTVTKITDIMVEGSNGYTAAAYDVFYVSNAAPESGSTKFNLTFTR